MANTLRLSDRGKDIVDDARNKKGWSRTASFWFAEAHVGEASLKRFWAKQPILRDSFISICEVVGVDWQKVSDSNSTELKQFIESSHNPLIKIASSQLALNFKNSSLKNLNIINKSFNKTIQELKIASIYDESRISHWQDHNSLLANKSLNVLDDKSVKILRQFGEINISCASIYQAPIVVLKSLRFRHGIKINLDYNYLHSPDQLANLRQHREHHFCFFTVAPFFLTDVTTASKFRLILPCTFNIQSLFQIPHTSTKRKKKVYIFEGSSAHAWHRASDKLVKNKLPQEKEFIKSEDIVKIISNGLLDSSSSIVIHEPLASTLSKKYQLQRMKNKTTERWICLFSHKDFIESKALQKQKVLSAFLNAFISEWNYCQAQIMYSIGKMDDEVYLDSLRQGTGLFSIDNL